MMEDLEIICSNENGIALAIWEGYIESVGYTEVYYIRNTSGYFHEIPARSKKEAYAMYNAECEKAK